jgi:uncharacterized protein YndB with AHSA1/START domain
MAYAEELVPADRSTVWAALVDPRTYPEWLAGCKDIRGVDEAWPAVGSAFHHRVGAGPVTLDDRTSIVDIQHERRLVLRIRATFAIQAVVTFELREAPGGTIVTFEEEPAHRLIGNVVRPVLDPLTHVRNKASLRRLATLLAAPAPSTL